MKRILALLLLLTLTISLVACSAKAENNDEKPQDDSEKSEGVYYTAKLDAAAEQTNFVQFEMANGATFVVELCPEYAPETVANFKSLVASGFYNGLTFHRLYKGFMIQGGCPNGNGTGSTTPIKGEFSSNGFTQNTLTHERGVISMARGKSNDSGSCQFFIMHEKATHLDGKYAAFGRVVAGMETIDYLATLPVTYQDVSNEITKPLDPPVIQSVTFVNYTAQ